MSYSLMELLTVGESNSFISVLPVSKTFIDPQVVLNNAEWGYVNWGMSCYVNTKILRCGHCSQRADSVPDIFEHNIQSQDSTLYVDNYL